MRPVFDPSSGIDVLRDVPAHAMSVFRCASPILCEVGVVSGDAETLRPEG
jgi:hypothetical protein